MPEHETRKIILKLVKEDGSSVLLIAGPEGIGKTHTVLNAFPNSTIKYFKYTKNDDNYQKMLDLLELKESVTKYLRITNAFSPKQATKNLDLIKILIMSKLDDLRENGSINLVFDDIENMDQDFLNFFFNIASKYLKENSKARIVGIYNSDLKNDELQNTIEILKTLGAKEIIMKPHKLEDVYLILDESGYKIPQKVIYLLYNSSNGKLKKIFQMINLLEEKGYIVEKTFIKTASETTINEIMKIIVTMGEEKILESLNPKEVLIIIYLSLLGEKIDPIKLMEILKLEEFEFVNAVDNLVRKKIVIEQGNEIEIREKEFQNYVEKSFSKLRLRDARLKIAKYLEEKGEKYKAGLQYYYANDYSKAYNLLVDSGNESYHSGDFYRALNAFTFAQKIIADNKDVNRKLVEILTIFDENDKIIEITNEIFKNDPTDAENILNLANALYKKSEYLESKKYYDLAFEKARNETEKAKAYYGIGSYYYSIEDYEKAKEYLNLALNKSKEIGEDNTEAKALRILGNIQYQNKDYVKALYYYEQSKAINESIGNYYDLAACYNNIANVSSVINLKEGKYYYLKSQEIAEKYWFPSMLQTLYINLGILNEYEGNVKEGLYLFKKAFGISIILGNYDATVLSIMNLLDLLIEMGNVEEAEKYVEIGIDNVKKIGKIYEEIEFEIFLKRIKKIKGEEIQWFDEIEKLRNSGIKYYVDFAELSLPSYYYYSGDVAKSNEIWENYSKEKIDNLSTDDLFEFIDLVELLVYEKFFSTGGIDEHARKYISIIEKNEFLEDMKYVKWRIEIIRAIEFLEKGNLNEAMKLYNENIKNLEDQDLRYLVSRLKLTFGIYLFKNFNDRTILDQGKRELKQFNMKGMEKALEKALLL